MTEREINEKFHAFLEIMEEKRMRWQTKTMKKPVAVVVGKNEAKIIVAQITISPTIGSFSTVPEVTDTVKAEGSEIRGLRVIEVNEDSEVRIV